MGYLSGYTKYKVLTLTGGASGAQTDFQLKIAVSYEAAMQGDFDDLRFTKADGTTLVDAWAELIVTDTSATVWVEFPTTPANTVEQIYRMYYGNAGAASDWDGDATFPALFDHFEGSSVDTGKWYHWLSAGTTSVASSILQLTGGGANSYEGWGALTQYSPEDYVMRWKGKTSAEQYDWLMGLDHRSNDGAGNADSAFFVYESSNKSYQTVNNGTKTNSARASTLTSYTTFEMLWKAASVEFYEDGVLKQTNNANIPNENMGATFLARSSSTSVYVDWVLYRKYAANPPTYAFGAEQSVPTGNPYWYYNLLKRRN